jgi:hypothetical protein
MNRTDVRISVSGFKSIAGKPLLLCMLLYPLFVVLFLVFIYPLISQIASPRDEVSHWSYYGLTGITLIFAIPFLYGLLFSLLQGKQYPPSGQDEGGVGDHGRSSLLIRLEVCVLLSFFVTLPVICLTDPVSTEGWLRKIYAAFLLAINVPFIFLLISCCREKSKRALFLSVFSVMLLLAVPSGLLLHHPWNYFAFFSPFYWVGWAWVINSPAESLMYGAISLAVTAVWTGIFYKVYTGNSGTALS